MAGFRRNMVVWLGLVVGLLWAGPAAATPRTGHSVTESLAIADATWLGHRCTGRVAITWAPLAAEGYAGHAPGAVDGSCNIVLDTSLIGDPTLCIVIVHEVGHLAGHEHEEGGIMNAVLPEYFSACRPTNREHAVGLILRLLPLRGTTRKWRVTCTPSVSRCRAVAPATKPRRYRVRGTGVRMSVDEWGF